MTVTKILDNQKYICDYCAEKVIAIYESSDYFGFACEEHKDRLMDDE